MRRSKRSRNSPSPAPARQEAEAGEQGGVSVVRREEALWQGPLPPPSALEEFKRLVPDAPERIFQQWEAEAAHRRAYEQRALKGTIARDRRGQWAAISFAMSALALAAFGVWMREPWVAGIVGFGTIAAVVGAFLYDRRAAQSKAD